MCSTGTLIIVAILFGAPLLVAPHTAAAQADQRCFAETRQCIAGAIRSYWERNGGVERFGYPITGVFEEQIEGRIYRVQYFERRRMEEHPELAGTPYDVQLGLLASAIASASVCVPAPTETLQRLVRRYLEWLPRRARPPRAHAPHGDRDELVDLNVWLGKLPHRHKLLVAGNHDWCFEEDAEACAALLPNAVYLQDTAVTLMGATFYGSPWTPRFYDWAFMLPRGAQLRERWAQIPAGTDVLITHGPPYGQGDLTFRGEHAGCEELAAAVGQLRPPLHIFGHIHEGGGLSADDATRYLNASIVDLSYRPVQPPLAVDLPLAR